MTSKGIKLTEDCWTSPSLQSTLLPLFSVKSISSTSEIYSLFRFPAVEWNFCFCSPVVNKACQWTAVLLRLHPDILPASTHPRWVRRTFRFCSPVVNKACQWTAVLLRLHPDILLLLLPIVILVPSTGIWAVFAWSRCLLPAFWPIRWTGGSSVVLSLHPAIVLLVQAVGESQSSSYDHLLNLSDWSLLVSSNLLLSITRSIWLITPAEQEYTLFERIDCTRCTSPHLLREA